MKEALYYKKLKNKVVQCQLCPNYCTIKTNNLGSCRVRKNVDGKLYSTTYGNPCSTAIDPIEKKPLFHFLPGSSAYSIATVGCNLHCLMCQNWQISQATLKEVPHQNMEPKKVVEEAINAGCQSISYTYTDPVAFYQYTLDIAKLAKKKGIKNTMITNGYINKEPLKELYKYVDAANVDLKGFTEDFYKKICGARLKPVLETLKKLHSMGVWIEITNLIIPTLNDDMKKIREMCTWIKKELSPDYPIHFSRFFPMYKLTHIEPTPKETLMKAYEVAKKVGLNYVYVGNIFVDKEDNTYCPKCKKLMIKRAAFSILENNIKNGKCGCGHKIAGVWK